MVSNTEDPHVCGVRGEEGEEGEEEERSEPGEGVDSCRQLLKVGGECLFQEKSTALLIGCKKDREWGPTPHFAFFLSSGLLTVASYF